MTDVPLLKEGEDYYFNEDGLMVMTEAYLLKKGHCCQSGCMHCPYGYTQKADPNIPSALQPEWKDDPEVYDGDIPEDLE
ncbi:MAG: hypothetical protein CME70_00370 [Halobacteriovorax sp.]|nr:hypothetical protein [Halobacteriovorax sp.]|tara:strand:- start:14677 stop:14913 length:237 start_codon:yes stop_codon:yes gene_type:complete